MEWVQRKSGKLTFLLPVSVGNLYENVEPSAISPIGNWHKNSLGSSGDRIGNPDRHAADKLEIPKLCGEIRRHFTIG